MGYASGTATVKADSSDTIAMIVEIVFGIFGILGMGWLYAGNYLVSILVFVGFAVVIFVEALVVGASLGLAACLIIPLNLVIAIISGLRARDYVRNSGAKGSLIHLLVGLIVGVTIICGGLFMLGVLGSALDSLQSAAVWLAI